MVVNEPGRELVEPGLEVLAAAAPVLIETPFVITTAVTVDGALPNAVG